MHIKCRLLGMSRPECFLCRPGKGDFWHCS